jgi:hypothetical protein
MYTSVLLLWVKVIVSVIKLRVAVARRAVTQRLYWALNAAVLAVFVAFIVAFYTVAEPQPLSCQAAEVRPRFLERRVVNVVYLVFVALLSILTALAYMVMGALFLRQMAGRHAVTKRLDVVLMTVVLLVTFAAFFVIRSCLLLWSALTAGVLPLLVFALLELVPSFALLYYMLPPLSQVEYGARLSSLTSKKGSSSSSSHSKKGSGSGSTSPSGSTTTVGSDSLTADAPPAPNASAVSSSKAPASSSVASDSDSDSGSGSESGSPSQSKSNSASASPSGTCSGSGAGSGSASQSGS